MASFGLSVSLTMAIITRFFVGLTNGMSVQSGIDMNNAFNLDVMTDKCCGLISILVQFVFEPVQILFELVQFVFEHLNQFK